ncbi:hypothetical protein OCAE111667_02785 [Occultella aeris]|uniref:DUF1269 domain-containing protein n=1 Tax=Occultella aeris TaxID=2761496 RepID=A0A7M4DGC4_9MICO|nr:hypothetical protein [Occultella aeris]VZO35967.1 hypothetical protein HALOF300_01171 [Occultella aeris]
MKPRVQLLAYRFGIRTPFEGQVIGALERLEADGAVRVIDVLLVGRDADSGEIFGTAAHGGPGGGNLARLLTFRLDPAERRRASRGVPADLLDGLGTTLDAGEVVIAVLVEQVWARHLEDSVAHLGGTVLPSSIVERTALADLTPELLDLAARRTD